MTTQAVLLAGVRHFPQYDLTGIVFTLTTRRQRLAIRGKAQACDAFIPVAQPPHELERVGRNEMNFFPARQSEPAPIGVSRRGCNSLPLICGVACTGP